MQGEAGSLTHLSALGILQTSLKAAGRRRVQPEPARRRKIGSGVEGAALCPRAPMVRWLYLSGLVLAVLIPAGGQLAPEELRHLARWNLFGAQNPQSFPSLIKRHSEGTFTSDFTRYLDRMKAKDFVHWLINTKRYN
ncbi:glucagon-1-like [Oenanthe melanoleuca]|uniref:glucagon-1-like n=1 Tax=Oenanthe melanoleuca TaxID=2939378 RepID=UPI0024C16C0E|nr:glucagon-1-like [Oenanthe melanoleuca]